MKKILKILLVGLAVIIGVPIFLGMVIILIDTFQWQEQPSSNLDVPTTNTYVDVTFNNELDYINENPTYTPITLSYVDYSQFLNGLNQEIYVFDMAQYYGLENALTMYQDTVVSKSTTSNLLDESGKLDLDLLMACVKKNNETLMADGENVINTFYTELSSADMKKICSMIVEVVNDSDNDIDISRVANTLTQLTMFQRTGSASNAYVTNELTFVYNPTMTGLYSDMQAIIGNSDNDEDVITSVIVHEVMHLLQYAASDNLNENGIEAGFCRMYNVPSYEPKLKVDALWYPWLLEAGAELGMASYLDIVPGTYAKKISYVNSYNLSRFNDFNFKDEGLEDVVFYESLNEVYESLSLNDSQSQKDFLNFMYSVEITQSNPDDFWENYTRLTNDNPSDSEKTALRMEVREDVIHYLTYHFYKNLGDAIKEGQIQDLETVFYLMKLWEIDVFSHLEYTQIASLPYASEMIETQEMMQNQLFQAIGSSNGYQIDELRTRYTNYHILGVDGDCCNLAAYETSTQNDLLSVKENYNTRYFADNHTMYNFIQK